MHLTTSPTLSALCCHLPNPHALCSVCAVVFCAARWCLSGMPRQWSCMECSRLTTMRPCCHPARFLAAEPCRCVVVGVCWCAGVLVFVRLRMRSRVCLTSKPALSDRCALHACSTHSTKPSCVYSCSRCACCRLSCAATACCLPSNTKPQLRLKPYYHFPMTLSYAEVEDILIPEKDYGGRETDFFKTSFASSGSRVLYQRFCTKLQQYKDLARGGGGGGGAVVEAQIKQEEAPVAAVASEVAAAQVVPPEAPPPA